MTAANSPSPCPLPARAGRGFHVLPSPRSCGEREGTRRVSDGEGEGRFRESRLFQLVLLAFLFWTTSSAAQQAGVRGLDVAGTEFRLVLGDGSVLPRDKLIGATLAFTNAKGQAIRFRIDGIEADAKDRDGDILLYRLTAPDDSGTWRDMCSFDPDGRSLGFPIAGTWDGDGNPVAGAPGAFTIACTSGALGKCVRFGYKPWKSIAGVRLDRHHAA